LGFALFVARDVGGGPVDEFLEAGFAVVGHGESMAQGWGIGKVAWVEGVCVEEVWCVASHGSRRTDNRPWGTGRRGGARAADSRCHPANSRCSSAGVAFVGRRYNARRVG
jgi:hypothetical protein